MTKIKFYNHHCLFNIHILKAGHLVSILGLIAHVAFFCIQVYRDQLVSVVGHAVSTICYVILLFGLQTNKTGCFIPYFLFNPVALLVQIFVEIHAHYKWWWRRTRFRWNQKDYFADLGLLILLAILIILTHCLMVSIIYRAFRCLKDISAGHHELEVELAEAEEFHNIGDSYENNLSGECSETGVGHNHNGGITFS